MKHCPICDERYDEEVIRFCTKDGTPLVDDDEPTFAELPSESVPVPPAIVAADEDEDEIGEVTVIRRRDEIPLPPTLDELNAAVPPSQPQSERIVIPTTQSEPVRDQQVRARTAPVYYPPPPQSNTAKTVFLTVLGTLLVLGAGAGLFWLLQKEKPVANTNVNMLDNQNTNLNSNLGFDANFNFNAAPNFNTNFNTNYSVSNLNANLKSPTPTATPKPSPSVTPSPSPSATPVETPTASPRPSGTPRPTLSPTPRMGPRPTPNPAQTP